MKQVQWNMRTRCVMLVVFALLLASRADSASWNSFPKRMSGTPAPVVNVPPYTIMTQEGCGLWRYSCSYIPGQKVTFKFMVNTNLVNTNFLYELRQPREITVSFGSQGGTYYLTNTPLGLVRVTEGPGTNRYMQLEFNWEDSPDPPTGLYADGIRPGQCTLHWTRSFELDVTGYNIYVSNRYYPYYRKMNQTQVLTNSFVITNLAMGATNFIYTTSLDAYTNMPNCESPPSSVMRLVSDQYITVLFYLKKNREEVTDSVYLCGDQPPLDWNFSRKMEYLYNNIWFFKGLFVKSMGLQYRYSIKNDSTGYENPFPTASGNREVVVSDPDADNVMTLNDAWSILTVSNPAPAPPVLIRVVPMNGSVSLFWSGNKEIDLKEYRIYRSQMNTNHFTLIQSQSQTNFLDTGLMNNTNYYYRLTALDIENNESGPSPVVSATPSTNPRPVVPIGLRVIPADHTNHLTWLLNPESDIQGYVVWRSFQKYSSYSNVSGLAGTNLFADSAVSNGTVYYYKLQAVDDINQTNQGYSEIVSALPGINPAPVKPQGLEMVLTRKQSIEIKWEPNPEPDILGYTVFYKKESGITESTNLGGLTDFTIMGLETGARYSIWIEARDSVASGEPSDVVTAYPVPEITDLAIKPSGTETGAVMLGFTSPDQAGSLGPPKRYIIKYSTMPLNGFSEFQRAVTAYDTRASMSGSLENLKVNNLGTDCPGYYFTLAAVYGNDQAQSLSASVFAVAGQVFSSSLGGIFRKTGERVQLVIPPFAVPQESSAVVIKTRQDLIKENNSRLSRFNEANDKAKAFSSVKLVNDNTNHVYDLVLIHSGGEEISIKNNFSQKISVYLPFNDVNHDLVVDETESASDKIPVKTLKMYWLNENISEWALIDDSFVDYVNNFIVANINHLTLFAGLSTMPAGDLKYVAVYPNPAYSPSENSMVVFTKLTENARIRIYNVAGELVKKDLVADSTGKCFWNGRNDSNNPVASGLYIYYVEDGSHEPARGKLAIVR